MDLGEAKEDDSEVADNLLITDVEDGSFVPETDLHEPISSSTNLFTLSNQKTVHSFIKLDSTNQPSVSTCKAPSVQCFVKKVSSCTVVPRISSATTSCAPPSILNLRQSQGHNVVHTFSTSDSPHISNPPVISHGHSQTYSIPNCGSMPNLASYGILKPQVQQPVMIFRTNNQQTQAYRLSHPGYPYVPHSSAGVSMQPQIITHRPSAHYLPNYMVPVRQPTVFSPVNQLYYTPCYQQPSVQTTIPISQGIQIYHLDSPRLDSQPQHQSQHPIVVTGLHRSHSTLHTHNLTSNNGHKANLIKSNSTSNLAIPSSTVFDESHSYKIRRALSPKPISVTSISSPTRSHVPWSTGSLILQSQQSDRYDLNSPRQNQYTSSTYKIPARRDDLLTEKKSRAEVWKDNTRKAYDKIWSRCKGEETCEILAARFQKMQVCDNSNAVKNRESHSFDIPLNSMLFEKAGTIPLPPREGVYIQGLNDNWLDETDYAQ